ncbi:HPr family phosphocarrier protein [Chlamydiales bacterium]|nr:HPr family phosphocarrier protein [Chlamydiales bacterium]
MEFKVKVKNPLGLHTRPATNIVRVLQNSQSHVSFTYKKQTINAKSILSILLLAVTRNSTITVLIDGRDAREVKERICEVLQNPYEDICTL